MTRKRHKVIRSRRDLLYDPQGHGDLCCLFDLVYDSKGHGVIRGRRDLPNDTKSRQFDLVYEPKRSRGH